MTGATPKQSSELIESEERRLEEVKMTERLRLNNWVRFVQSNGPSFDDIFEATTESTSVIDYFNHFRNGYPVLVDMLMEMLEASSAAQADFNEARHIVGLMPVEFDIPAIPAISGLASASKTRRRAKASSAEAKSKTVEPLEI